MKLEADRLATEGLVLELPDHHGNTNVLRLGRSGGVTGVYAQDADGIHLRNIAGEELQITGLTWHVPGARIATESPAKLSGVVIDAEIPLARALGRAPFVGGITVAAAESDALTLDLAQGRVNGELDLESVAYAQAEDGSQRVTLAAVALHDAQGELAGLPLQVDEVRLQGVEIDVGADGALRLAATRAQIARLVLHVGRFEVKIEQIDLAGGLSFADGEIAFPDLAVSEVVVTLDDLLSLITGGREHADTDPQPPQEVADDAEAAAAQARAAVSREPFDLRLLDRLNGQIDVDLTADTTVPLIGRRKATHHFRIPITDGTINYRELERDLAALEDAFIDINVRDGKLSLEKDIPLLPFYHKTLVYWHLSEDDHNLAKQRLVRLRTLFAWEIPEERKQEAESAGDDEKSKLAVRRLDFANIDVDLSIDKPTELAIGGGLIKLGTLEKPGIGALALDGDVRYDARQAIEPTELKLEVKALNAAVTDLPLGGARLSAGAIELAALDPVKLVFAGFQPKALSATLRGLNASDVSCSLARTPS